MLRIAILADDLTGAADTCARFLPFVDKATLFVKGSHPLEERIDEELVEAWALHTASRSLSPREAFDRTWSLGSRIMSFKPEVLYKKIDSCMRGNVGAEVDALLEACGRDVSLIAPAHPEMGRITIKGIHLLRGAPVSETEMGTDPISPVTSSAITEIISATSDLPVAHIGLDEVRGGVPRLQETILSLRKKGFRHISFDAVDLSDLELIARAGLGASALLVGSAGLATALARVSLSQRPEPIWTLPTGATERPWLMVLGSSSRVTRRQAKEFVKEFPSNSIFVSCREGAGDNSLTVGDRHGDRHLLILPRVVEPGEGSMGEKAQSLLEGMAFLATKVAREMKFGGLFLTGGDTAQAILSGLGATKVRLRKETIPGVILGEIEDGPFAGTIIATKAGSFGAEDTLVKFFRLLGKQNDKGTL